MRKAVDISSADFLSSNALNRLFLRMPPEEIQQVAREVEAECLRQGLTYVAEDGVQRIIPLMLRPRIINPIQRSYFHYVCLQMLDGLKKLAALYLVDPRIRRLLPISEAEEKWLRQSWADGVPRFHTVISRLDANTDFTAPDWRENFQFFEANSVGVGGLYYVPVAERIILDVVGTRLQRLEPELFLEPNYSTRDLLLDELRLHARSIRRPRCNIAILDDPGNVGGITEYPHLADYFRSRGYPAVVADPRDVQMRGDQLYHRDLPLDVLYRDVEVKELIRIEEQEGRDLTPIRKAFQANQVVSSPAGDFDHKSCWEVFTDDQFAHHFTAAQWRIFNRHMLWTRLIRDTRTADDSGRMIDLVPYARQHRHDLVLKPNREFGGSGVVIGPEATESEWDVALQVAVSNPWTHVVQRYTPVRTKDFPVIRGDGTAGTERFHVTCGFIVSASEIGILGRVSKETVVNIAQRGGMSTVLMILDQQNV
jgi:hypothetical protein